jgi:hypothetical protein
MANDIPFEKQFQRILSNKLTSSPPIRSSSLTSFKQHRYTDNQVFPDYKWIFQSDETRHTQQKNLEERQKVCMKNISRTPTYFLIFFRKLSMNYHLIKLLFKHQLIMKLIFYPVNPYSWVLMHHILI